MKTRFVAPLGMLLILSLFAGCGDESSTGPKLTGEGAPAQAMIDGVLTPSIEGINLATYASLLTAPAGLPAFTACEPLDICESGSAEICSDTSGVTFNFYDCVSHNTTVDGSVQFVGTASSGSATLDITLNGNPVAGTITYFTEGTCFTQTFNGVTATVDGYTATIFGDLEFCAPSQMVNGVIVPRGGSVIFYLSEQQRAINVWFYESETPGAFSLNVNSLDFTEVFLFCTGYLYGSLECEVPSSE